MARTVVLFCTKTTSPSPSTAARRRGDFDTRPSNPRCGPAQSRVAADASVLLEPLGAALPDQSPSSSRAAAASRTAASRGARNAAALRANASIGTGRTQPSSCGGGKAET